MSYKNENKPKTRHYGLMTVVIFCCLLIYILGYLAVFVSKPSIGVETVEYGSIQVPHVYNGVVVRSETAYKSDREGIPLYNVSDKTRVKKNALVCTISDSYETQEIENQIEKIDRDWLRTIKAQTDASAYRTDLDQIDKNITGIVDSYAYTFLNGDVSSVYNLRAQVDSQIESRNAIWLTAGGQIDADELQARQEYEEQFSQGTSTYYSDQSGLVSYKNDGLEAIFTPDTMEDVTLDDVYNYVAINQNSQNMKVNKDDTIYKIVSSNTWYIVTYIQNSVLEPWEEGLLVSMYAESDAGEETTFIAEVYKMNVDPMYTRVVLRSDQKITEFLGMRNIEFSTKDTIYAGIKIPVSAIVEKTLLKVPKKYTLEREGVNGVLRRTSMGASFTSLDEVMSDDDYVYFLQDFENVKIGTVIVDPDTKEDYEITETYTCSGVYLANTSIAQFTITNVLGKNNEYAIVEANTTYGLKIYDSIVSDASAISESQSLS